MSIKQSISDEPPGVDNLWLVLVGCWMSGNQGGRGQILLLSPNTVKSPIFKSSSLHPLLQR
jgi:hypothetical protein